MPEREEEALLEAVVRLYARVSRACSGAEQEVTSVLLDHKD